MFKVKSEIFPEPTSTKMISPQGDKSKERVPRYDSEGSVGDNVFDMEVNGSSRLTPVVTEQRSATAPSPTGYRDYKPPAEVLSNSYSTTFHTSGGFDSARANFKRDQEKEEDFAHKTILLGDSGVGKTSLLVQFDTGNFQPGNFAATVGIGFTVCNVEFNIDTGHTCIPCSLFTASKAFLRSLSHLNTLYSSSSFLAIGSASMSDRAATEITIPHPHEFLSIGAIENCDISEEYYL
ncbi:ras-related protein Rab-37-like [Vespula squamosa]|uniref:Ras-related protein Rab-37-like n=1 Tax=Vespula squamosa TaxID=30214 RepID=A0ABD2A8J1_VESSQ